MDDARRRQRVEWVAIAVTAAALALSVWLWAKGASRVERHHHDLGEALGRALVSFGWLVLGAGAFWIKIRVEYPLNRR